MRRKALPKIAPVVSPEILEQAKRSIATDRTKSVAKCTVCGAEVTSSSRRQLRSEPPRHHAGSRLPAHRHNPHRLACSRKSRTIREDRWTGSAGSSLRLAWFDPTSFWLWQ